MADTPAWALKRIDRFRKEAGAARLSLVGKRAEQLTAIPPEVLPLTQIEELTLKDNRIDFVPALGEVLPSLRVLDLRGNRPTTIADQAGLILDYETFEEHRARIAPGNVLGLAFSAMPERGILTGFPGLRRLHLHHVENVDAIPADLFDLSALEVLDIFQTKIGELPPQIGRLISLQSLDLGSTELSSVPDAIFGLTNLEHLSLLSNDIDQLDGRLFGLSRLKSLRLDFNRISEIPPEIGQLTELRELLLVSNDIARLPDALWSLAKLEELDVSLQELIDLPSSVGRLRRLRSLDVRGTKIERLPPEIGGLAELTELWFGHTGVSSVPNSFAALRRIRTLDLARTRITRLPEWVVDLPELEHLYIGGNSLENVPPELISDEEFDPVDLERLRDYFRQRREAGTDYLCEAKLLVVGEGEAGKTTLAKKLCDPAYVLDAGEPPTEGIDVMDWIIPARIPIRGAAAAPAYIDRDIAVHIWDFAGQEITYATHQFFLTKRSLYVLVVDNRRNNPNFDYWLSVVELLSDDSPLVIVKNEKHGTTWSFNESEARARFPNIKEIRSVNLATGRGLPELAQLLRTQIQSLDHIGTPLPSTWKRVRAALEARPESYISQDELLRVCDQHGFKRHEDKLGLSEYLHDLGAFLHFQREPALKGTVFLKPTWVTQAVYRVVRDRAVTDGHGRFQRSDLTRIWHEAEYAPVRDELLELMRKFKLCYPLGEPSAFMIPQLLPTEPPAYPWDPAGNLQVIYQYDFMPRGIVSKLIVDLHRAIERPDWVWREGVVLARGGARAEIVESHAQRRIQIRLAGPNRLPLLGAAVKALEDIHADYHRLKASRLLPCQCPRCASAADPYFFDAETVRDCIAQRGDTIQCHKSFQMVPVRVVLEAVGEELVAMNEGPAGADLGRAAILTRPEARAAARSGEVFISYATGGASEAMAEKVEAALQRRGLTVVRDKKDLQYKGDIAAFVQRLGRGDCVVTIISDRYLRSEWCMQEIVAIAGPAGARADLIPRVFPIVLPDARIYDAVDGLDYVAHWEDKRDALDAKMKSLRGSQHLQGFRERLDLYDDIRDVIARITEVLRTTNTLSPDRHADGDFVDLYAAIQARCAA